MSNRYDVIVVGAGVIGAATARSLAARGRHTLILERFQLAHERGSSHGLSRIVRVTDYHPDYVRLNRLALRAWQELEDAAKETLLVRTGNLEIGSGAQTYADALAAAGEQFRWLSGDEACERWPALRFAAGEKMFVQEDGGVCFADRTVRAQARLAVESGAELWEGTPAERILPSDSGAEIHVAGKVLSAPVVVVTAGAWAGSLLAEAGIRLRLTPTLEQVSYYNLRTPSLLPTVVDYTIDASTDHYALPDPGRIGGLKLALDHAGPTIDPETRPFGADKDRLARVEAWARDRFKEMIPTDPPETCLYTNTLDRDYVLDRVGPIVVGSACSGHGFKASPVVGRILADLATGSQPPVPLSRYRASRPSLAL